MPEQLTPTAEQVETETVITDINTAIESGHSKEEIFANLEKAKDAAEGAKRETIEAYIGGIRGPLQGMLVKELDAGVGGLNQGETVVMAKDSLYIDATIEATIAKIKEIADHEKYHKEFGHTRPMVKGSSAEGEAIVTIGGEKMDSETLFEGITVDQTGDAVVSDEYRGFNATFSAAIEEADLSVRDVEKAIMSKDLRRIDDADRARQEVQVEEDIYAVAP